MFAIISHLQLSLIIAGKLRAYPSGALRKLNKLECAAIRCLQPTLVSGSKTGAYPIGTLTGLNKLEFFVTLRSLQDFL